MKHPTIRSTPAIMSSRITGLSLTLNMALETSAGISANDRTKPMIEETPIRNITTAVVRVASISIAGSWLTLMLR